MVLNQAAVDIVRDWFCNQHRRTDVILIYTAQLTLAILVFIILTLWTHALLAFIGPSASGRAPSRAVRHPSVRQVDIYSPGGD